jgi:hypothetical protein
LDGAQFHVKPNPSNPSTLELLFFRLLGIHTVLYVEAQFASLPGKFFSPILAASRVLEGRFVTPVSVDGLASFSVLLRVAVHTFPSDGDAPKDGSSVPIAYVPAPSGTAPHVLQLHYTCRPRQDMHTISIAANRRIIDVRREIAGQYASQVCVLRQCGSLVPDFAPAAGSDGHPFEVFWVRLPRQVAMIKLRSPREDAYYYVDVYIDETIGCVKKLMQQKHGHEPDRLLISEDIGELLQDDVPIWNIDLSATYRLTIARRAVPRKMRLKLAVPAGAAIERLSVEQVRLIKAPWRHGERQQRLVELTGGAAGDVARQRQTPNWVTPRDRPDFEQNAMKLAAMGFDLDQAIKTLRARKYIFNLALDDLLDRPT